MGSVQRVSADSRAGGEGCYECWISAGGWGGPVATSGTIMEVHRCQLSGMYDSIKAG